MLGQVTWRLAWPALSVLLLVLLGPMLWTLSPTEQVLIDRLQGPSMAHPLGTDQLGRDVLARLLHGGRISLGISVVVTVVSVVVGVAVGSVAALSNRWIDRFLMVIVDVMLAFPFILLALTIAGLSGGGAWALVLAISLASWTTFARVTRGETLRVQSTPMIEAAEAVGSPPWWVYMRHVLPNAIQPILVLAIVRFSHTMLTIAGLSFLGVGVQPPMAEWGAMLRDGMPFIERAPHLVLAPGATVTLAALLVSMTGERTRHALDPRRR